MIRIRIRIIMHIDRDREIDRYEKGEASDMNMKRERLSTRRGWETIREEEEEEEVPRRGESSW